MGGETQQRREQCEWVESEWRGIQEAHMIAVTAWEARIKILAKKGILKGE